jgi:hypothetical protein
MSDRGRVGIGFKVLAVAMAGKAGQLDPQDVHDLVTEAEQVLGSANALTRAIMDFATQYEVDRYDAAIVAALADRLHERLEVLAMPVPPGEDRADIHG